METIQLTIVSAEGEIFAGPAKLVVLPASDCLLYTSRCV